MTQMDRIRADLQRWQETGELPPAWDPELTEAPEIGDAEFAAAMRELDALETGCLDDDDPRHPGHPVTCRRPCCRPVGWEP